ncbi:MAG: hypothetical protein ACJ8CB_13995 [Ktedonobacteraceae bacterium]
MAELIGILRGEDQQALKHHTMRGSAKQMTKKKRVPRAQSRLALARFRQQQREQRQQTAAHRAQQWWNKTLRHLADLGATVKQREEAPGDKEKTVYEVTFEGKTSHFRSRFRVQRWLKRERERQEEQQMSWAERQVEWMIDQNCDDHGNPWPDWAES